MSFTKLAYFDVTNVLDVKGSAGQARSASLSKLGDFESYRTEDGYLYARCRAISSRVNRNHDGWPSVELAGSPDIFDRHITSAALSRHVGGFTIEASKDEEYGFSTFLGKPIYIDHNNHDPQRARGVVVDAKLHVEDLRTASALDPYYASAPDNHTPPTWVELLLEVDAKSFPKFAAALIEGSRDPGKGIDGFSMGCDVERTQCNICQKFASSPDEYCQHVKLKGATFDYHDPKTRKKTSKKAYEDCYGIKFFEISGVFDPADETALLKELKTSTSLDRGYPQNSELLDAMDYDGPPCPHCRGAGSAHGGPCPGCDGTGVLHGSDGAALMHPDEMPHDPAVENVMSNGESWNPTRNYGAYTTASSGSNAQVRFSQEAPLPQADLTTVPSAVDTLRDERLCPICGSTLDDVVCGVCGYTEPPDGMGNPDLSQAQDQISQEQPPGPIPPDPLAPKNPQPLAHVTSDMEWNVTLHPKVAGRINPSERPILTNPAGATNEPKETILSDETKPVTSNVRAADMIASAGATRRTPMEHTAEAASGAPSVAKPDVNVSVTDIGGVADASNEAASKADAQVDVTAIGGTGVEGVSAEKEGVNVEQGSETSKNIEAIPTKTFGDGSSAVEHQHDPVTSEPFPASEDGVKRSHDDAAFPAEDGGLGGGSAQQGTQPSDPVGKAQDRVDVLDSTTSPANNSGPTKTWSGTDGNGVTKQQDPVTNETIEGTDGVKAARVYAAFKLADREIELGLLNPQLKYERVAELESETLEQIRASLSFADRVKKAGLVKQQRTATRMPSFSRPSLASREASTETEVDPSIEDSALFS